VSRNSIEAERNAFKDKHAQEETAHGRTRLERQDSHIRHEKEINGLSEAGREFGEFANEQQEMFYNATPEEMIKSLGNQLRAAKAELAEANLKIKQAEEASREFGEFAEMEQERFYALNVRPADVIRTLGNKLRAATAAQHKKIKFLLFYHQRLACSTRVGLSFKLNRHWYF
jgi:hypothetical protein